MTIASAVLRIGLALLFGASSMATRAAEDPPRDADSGPDLTPVLVELFTSEGCSSCPPADDYLAQLQRVQPVRGAEIVALGYHVDYWDDLGWKDPFSAAEFSDRQRSYAVSLGSDRIYTPQLVVDGAAELVGSERGRALTEVGLAARRPKAALQLVAVADGERKVRLQVAVESLPERTPDRGAEVWIAIAEDGLSSDVRRGENRGRTLEHGAVVRTLRRVGSIEPGSGSRFDRGLTVAIDPGWSRERCRAVAFVQEPLSRRVLGVGAVPLPEAAD